MMNDINVKGKSTSQLLKLNGAQLNKLSRKELAKIVSRLSSTANKRLRRFEKHDITSPATEYVKRTGGKFSVKGKNVDSLKKEYLRVKGFLESETSTITGAKKVRKDVINKLKYLGVDIKENQYDKFFKVYERLKEVDRTVSDKLLKYNVFEEISNTIDNPNIDDIVNEIQKRIDEIYQQSIGEDEYDLSRFFEIE